jgi:cysteine desulfurase/selenocysteine lyase
MKEHLVIGTLKNMKKQFPIFRAQKKPFIYLDSGATTQKPQVVIDALVRFYTTENSNIHRGLYSLSEKATHLYEDARETVREFIHAKHSSEIIFTSGTTASINVVAHSWGDANIQSGDEILVTELEHHSNFVPWQQVAKRKGAYFKVVPCEQNGRVSVEAFKKLLTRRTKVVALTHVSNVTGSILPLKEIIHASHARGARVLVDSAQSVGHLPIDVTELDCDWLAFSGHKMYGPTGVGVLYGKKEILESMEPVVFGGGMISEVTNKESTWAQVPQRFEAGTPPIAEVIGLASAIRFLREKGMKEIMVHERALTSYALAKLSKVPGLSIVGPEKIEDRIGVISFCIEDAHAHDIASLLAERGIAIRAGHHCAKPFFHARGISASCRMSIGMYNDKDDIDMLVQGLLYAITTLRL